LSTAGFLPSALESIHYLNTIEGIEAVVISDRGEVMTTNGLVDISINSTVLFAV
jgi:thiamine biosynthesis lipoprotein